LVCPSPAMADTPVQIATGRFTVTGGTGNQAITGVGFQPKAYVLIYTKNATDDADSTGTGSILSIGMADGTTQFCMASGSENAQGAADVGRRGFSDEVLCTHDAQTDQTVQGEANHVSMDVDGFTINKAVAFTAPASPLVHYIAFGGDGISVDVGTVDLNDTQDALVDVTAPGFEPDLVLASYIGVFLDATGDGNNDDHSFSLGWAVNPARQAANNQYSMMVASADSADPTETISRFDNVRAGTSYRDDAIDASFEIGSFDASGFSVTTRLTAATTSEIMGYLAINLGPSPKVYSVARTARTSTGNDVESSAGFQPIFLLGMGSAVVTAANTNTNGASMAIGITDGTDTFAIMQYDEDNNTTSDTANRVTNTQFMSANLHTGAISWEATFTSFDSGGWTINYGDAAGSAYQNAFLAIGQGGCYGERFTTWSATSADTWQTQTLSVPANAVVEVAVRNSRVDTERYGGVRAVGSSLERRFLLSEAEDGGVTTLIMHAQTNSSSQIQHYSDVTAEVTFALLGYWICGTYVERFDTFTAGANTTWTDKNLCSYGVGPGHVAEIVLSNDDTGNEREAGVRTNGSSLQRRLNIVESEGGGVATGTMFVEADTSTGSTIEVYAQDDTDVDFYLVGYWSEAPLAYTELFTDVGSPSSSATWQDRDLTANGLPDSAVAEFVLSNEDAANQRTMGVRTNGSGINRYLDVEEAEAGGWNMARMHVASDATATIEHYHSNVASANSFYLTGYWDSCGSSSSYVITDLGAITGANRSQAYHINATAKIAGFEENASGNPSAWFQNCGTFTALGTLGGSYAEAHGINATNRVVGWAQNGSGKRRAFTWVSPTMTDLGVVSGRTDSEALSVNASAEVVGTVLNFGSPPKSRLAFLYLPAPAYTLSAGMNSLGTLGGTQSVAMDISDSGRVVGGAQNAGGNFRPFRWNTGTMTDLGTLGGNSVKVDHRAEAVNSSGNIAGRSYTAGGAARAFYWNGSMTDLGVLTGGTESWAFGLNDSNVVVGTSNVTGGAFHAFVWDSVNGTRDLNNLIPGGSGWTLTRATDVNNDGFITGWGTNGSGDVRAFLLTPTCKSGGGAAASALLAFGEGLTDDSGVFDGVAVDVTGIPLATVELIAEEAGVIVEFEVLESGEVAPAPVILPNESGLETIEGISLKRTLKVNATESAGDLAVTVSMSFSLDEIAFVDADPAELQLLVLDRTSGEPPGIWIPAGKNIGESAPTGIVGEAGYNFTAEGSVDYWAVRDVGGTFAVARAEADGNGPGSTPGGPSVCGAAMIGPLLLGFLVLLVMRLRSRPA